MWETSFELLKNKSYLIDYNFFKLKLNRTINVKDGTQLWEFLKLLFNLLNGVIANLTVLRVVGYDFSLQLLLLSNRVAYLLTNLSQFLTVK